MFTNTREIVYCSPVLKYHETLILKDREELIQNSVARYRAFVFELTVVLSMSVGLLSFTLPLKLLIQIPFVT